MITQAAPVVIKILGRLSSRPAILTDQMDLYEEDQHLAVAAILLTTLPAVITPAPFRVIRDLPDSVIKTDLDQIPRPSG
jgi:hypothetical protein